MKRRTFARSVLGLSLALFLAPTEISRAASSADPAGSTLMGGSLSDVPGIKVGHHTLARRPTGCTVLRCEEGAVAGVDVSGSAPGTRETDLLDPVNTVQRVQAVLLSGGSAFGLDAATGVVRYLEERKLGFPVGSGVVPIVPAAILFDLGVGDFAIRPDAEAGYQACLSAASGPLPEGNVGVGAGAGATVGKMFGPAFAMKGGLGTASHRVPGTGVVVGALVAVNAVGDVRHPQTHRILAGARAEEGRGFRDTTAAILNGHRVVTSTGANTTIGAVATNVPFSKAEMTKIAQMAQDGFARAISPVHTMSDGDTIFALSTGKAANLRADVSAVGAIAAVVMAHAVARAVVEAESLPEHGLPAHRNYVQR